MGLSIAVEQLGMAVGVVMSLKNNVNVIGIKDWCQLGTKNHTIGIGVIQTASVDILMDCNNTPCGIWICLSCFL